MLNQNKPSLPEAFLKQVQSAPGFRRPEFEAVHAADAPLVSVRLNPTKTSSLPGSIADGARSVPWSTQGFYLPKRPLFTLDPFLHAGAYYVQEASSMFLEQVYQQALVQTGLINAPLRVLDLCAAPGGKSTLLQSLLKPEDLLIANEVIKTRVTILEENLTKWGSDQVLVTHNDPKDFGRLSAYFDVVVVDAPCSGSGLFRKDPDAIEHWSEELVTLCSQRQQRIVADVWPSLKPGGVLIYSTCSYSMQENEEMTDWILKTLPAKSLPIQLDAWQPAISRQQGPVETRSTERMGYGYRFYPDRIEGEGFFIAAVVKEGDYITSSYNRKSDPKNKCSKEEQALARTFLEAGHDFIFKQGDQLRVMPSFAEPELGLWQQSLYIRKAGTAIGEWARKELIPDPELALSSRCSRGLGRQALSLEQALAYLRKEEFQIDTDLKGWQLMSYQGLGLGWAKILTNRINNYYPKEWRIRMSGSR
jgi:16S rRNA C967 or C1407 C5-methylase (RsmB/RsmF family)/NOL1/NOP2/fmu family ribosome biogenesis protein